MPLVLELRELRSQSSPLDLTVPLELPEFHPQSSPLDFTVPLEPESPLSLSPSSPFNFTVPLQFPDSPPSLTADSSPNFDPSQLPELEELESPGPQIFKGIDLANSDETSSIIQIVEIGDDALLAYDALLLKSQYLTKSLHPPRAPAEEGTNLEDGEPLVEHKRNVEPNDGGSIRSQSIVSGGEANKGI